MDQGNSVRSAIMAATTHAISEVIQKNLQSLTDSQRGMESLRALVTGLNEMAEEQKSLDMSSVEIDIDIDMLKTAERLVWDALDKYLECMIPGEEATEGIDPEFREMVLGSAMSARAKLAERREASLGG